MGDYNGPFSHYLFVDYGVLLQNPSKKKRGNVVVKQTLNDASVIRKYQVQLQRSLGNIDILGDELKRSK